MTDRQAKPTRARYYWAAIVGNEMLHAWKDRRARSVTHCGMSQVRSRNKPDADAKRCSRCHRVVELLEAERVRAEVSKSLEEIRPESVDPDAWHKAAKKLVRMV